MQRRPQRVWRGVGNSCSLHSGCYVHNDNAVAITELWVGGEPSYERESETHPLTALNALGLTMVETSRPPLSGAVGLRDCGIVDL